MGDYEEEGEQDVFSSITSTTASTFSAHFETDEPQTSTSTSTTTTTTTTTSTSPYDPYDDNSYSTTTTTSTSTPSEINANNNNNNNNNNTTTSTINNNSNTNTNTNNNNNNASSSPTNGNGKIIAVNSKAHWVPDSSSNKCSDCSTLFTFFKRRHHCRKCGKLFCGECCSLRCSLPEELGYQTRVRVCSSCFVQVITTRAFTPTVITPKFSGGVSAETKLVSAAQKAVYWKMGAYDGAQFDRSFSDAIDSSVKGVIAIEQVQDLIIESQGTANGLRLRVYTPGFSSQESPRRAIQGKDGALPVLIWCHSGGFSFKTVESSSVDGLCRLLANQIPCIVISVDYSLSPENKFPLAVHECYQAVNWVKTNYATIRADPHRIAIGGDGSGGNLAAAVCILARDKGGPFISKQILICPWLDLTPYQLYVPSSYPSRNEFKDGYMISIPQYEWFRSSYLPPQTGQPLAPKEEAYASPLRVPKLDGLPPAHIITAGYDPFRDEGEQYAQKLRDQGGKVKLTRYSNSSHSFFGSGLDENNEAIMEVSLALNYDFRKAFEISFAK